MIYLDTSIACAHSDDQSRQRARSGRDGIAAQNREDDKRRRYPPQRGEVAMLFIVIVDVHATPRMSLG